MRIACLQFAPQLGKVKENVARADALLSISSPQSLDILVLPELAFTGILYPSSMHLKQSAEPITQATISPL